MSGTRRIVTLTAAIAMAAGEQKLYSDAMIANLIIKALFFYLAYLVLRGLWRGYKIYGAMQEAIKQGQGATGQGSYQHAQRSQSQCPQGDVIEAEYRVVSPKKDH